MNELLYCLTDGKQKGSKDHDANIDLVKKIE